MPPQPVDDDALVDLVETLAGLRRELAPLGVTVSTTVDVAPEQPFGPWQAVLDAVRAGVAALDDPTAGTLLERALPVSDRLGAVLPVASAAAELVGRASAVDAAVAAAVDDAGVLAARVAADQADVLVAVEATFATALGASYATWVVRDALDADSAAAGAGLVDVVLRPGAAAVRLRSSDAAAAVLDVAAATSTAGWEALAEAARARPDGEAMAAVRVRALAALAGLGGGEVAAVAGLAPHGVGEATLGDAAVVVGDAAVAAAAATDVADDDSCRLAAAAWRRATTP